jgi:hypothetical protein
MVREGARGNRVAIIGGLLLLSCLTSAAMWGQAAPGDPPMATEDRVKLPGWWPTKGSPQREEFIGPAACKHCHADKATSYQATPMAHASMPVANSDLLRSHSQLSFQVGPYRYQIARTDRGNMYSVSDGTDSITAALTWAFGFGIGYIGQTYVYRRNGALYESRLSYYPNSQTLDFSPGHPRSVPTSLGNALGRPIYPEETRLCFGCHTTASTTGNQFDPSRLISGVSCEACHGPAVEHVVAMTTGQGSHGSTYIFNPIQLKPVASVEFCGACHRTEFDVALSGSEGISTIRFAPFRLEQSRCWGNNGDSRLTCIACHDPHKPLEVEAAPYDQRCLSCHASGTRPRAAGEPVRVACPVSAKNCVSCHMPKYEILEMHASFTDHRIRVVKESAPFSD